MNSVSSNNSFRKRVVGLLMVMIWFWQCPFRTFAYSINNNNNNNPFSKIANDYRALTRRVTARHIMLPTEDLCATLKRNMMQRIESDASDDDDAGETNNYVVNVMAQYAQKYSQDDSTKHRGGLIGALVPQGTCRSSVIDKACFEVPVGSLQGPIQSEFGCHLLLVEERTNCPQLDHKGNKLVPSKDTGYGRVVVSRQSNAATKVTPQFLAGQIVFWLVVALAGGVMAEVLAALSN